MARGFLKGGEEVVVNLVLAAAAWNLKKWIKEVLFVPIFVIKEG